MMYTQSDILNNEITSKPPAMTFIFGSRCHDGVVLVADRKITTINEFQSIHFEYKEKLFGIIRQVIFGSSGSTHTYELFRDYVVEEIRKSNVTYDNTIMRLCDIVLEINKKRDYNRELYFELLVGIQYPDDRVSSLTWITGQGVKELKKTYYTLGMGTLFSEPFLEQWWHPNISMEGAAALAYFIIKRIEDYQLHSSVGVGKYNPQIWFIPDNERNEKGEKIDYLVDPETRPEQFQRIKKDALKRFSKQKRSLK